MSKFEFKSEEERPEYVYFGIMSNMVLGSDAILKPIQELIQTEDQTITLEINGKITNTLSITLSLDSISIEEFQKKYLPDINEEDIWLQFKTDLWEEVKERKISKIKFYRIINKLTQKDLAKKIDTKQPDIVRLEKVGYSPNIETMKKLAKVFQLHYKELLD
jgi:DNA-binding XRE family transcriptional regulator